MDRELSGFEKCSNQIFALLLMVITDTGYRHFVLKRGPIQPMIFFYWGLSDENAKKKLSCSNLMKLLEKPHSWNYLAKNEILLMFNHLNIGETLSRRTKPKKIEKLYYQVKYSENTFTGGSPAKIAEALLPAAIR